MADRDQVSAALDWSRQRADFEADGTLRDIYVEHTDLGDWCAVLAHIVAGDYSATLKRGGAAADMPANSLDLFDWEDLVTKYTLDFRIESLAVTCQFFTVDTIEFSFEPTSVDEASLNGLLYFIMHLGTITHKRAAITFENLPHARIFQYDPDTEQLEYIAEGGRV